MALIDPILTIAQNTYDELDNPTDTSITAIASWMRNNLGRLNTAINTVFVLNSDLSVSPDIDLEAQNILTKMYLIRYYDKQIRSNLGASAIDPVRRVSSDGFTVEKLVTSDFAKIWNESKKTLIEDLDKAIRDYRVNKSQTVQVAGNDDTPGSSYYDGVYIRTLPTFYT